MRGVVRRGRMQAVGWIAADACDRSGEEMAASFDQMEACRFNAGSRCRGWRRFEFEVVAVDHGRGDCDISRCEFRAGVDDENDDAKEGGEDGQDDGQNQTGAQRAEPAASDQAV